MSSPSLIGFPRPPPVANRFMSKVKSPPTKGFKDGRPKTFMKKGIFGKYAQFFKSQQSAAMSDSLSQNEAVEPSDHGSVTDAARFRPAPLRGPPLKAPPSGGTSSVGTSGNFRALTSVVEPRITSSGESTTQAPPKAIGLPHKALMAATLSQIRSLKPRKSPFNSLEEREETVRNQSPAALAESSGISQDQAALVTESEVAPRNDVQAPVGSSEAAVEPAEPPVGSSEAAVEPAEPSTNEVVHLPELELLVDTSARAAASGEAVTSAPASSLDSRSAMTSAEVTTSKGFTATSSGRDHSSIASRAVAVPSEERRRSNPSNEHYRFDRLGAKSPAAGSAHRTVPLLVQIDPPLGIDDRPRSSPIARGKSLSTTPVIKMCRNSRGEVMVERSPGDGSKLHGAWPTEVVEPRKQSDGTVVEKENMDGQTGEDFRQDDRSMERRERNLQENESCEGPMTPQLQKQVTQLMQEGIDGFKLSVATESACSSPSMSSQQGTQSDTEKETRMLDLEPTVDDVSRGCEPSAKEQGSSPREPRMVAESSIPGSATEKGKDLIPPIMEGKDGKSRDEEPDGKSKHRVPNSAESTSQFAPGPIELGSQEKSCGQPNDPGNAAEVRDDVAVFLAAKEDLDEPTVSGATTSVSSMDETIAARSKKTGKGLIIASRGDATGPPENEPKVVPSERSQAVCASNVVQEMPVHSLTGSLHLPNEVHGKANRVKVRNTADSEKDIANTEVVSIDLSSGVRRRGQVAKTGSSGLKNEVNLTLEKRSQRGPPKASRSTSRTTMETAHGNLSGARDSVSERAQPASFKRPHQSPSRFRITAGQIVLGSPVASLMVSASPNSSAEGTRVPQVVYYKTDARQDSATPILVQPDPATTPVSYERGSVVNSELQVLSRGGNSASTTEVRYVFSAIQSHSRSSISIDNVTQIPAATKHRRHTTALDLEEIAEFDRQHLGGSEQRERPAMESVQRAQQSISRVPTPILSLPSTHPQPSLQTPRSARQEAAVSGAVDSIAVDSVAANLAPVITSARSSKAEPVEGSISPKLDLAKAIAYRGVPSIPVDATWRQYGESPLKGGPISAIQCLVTSRRGRPLPQERVMPRLVRATRRDSSAASSFSSRSSRPSTWRSSSGPASSLSSASRSFSCSAVERAAVRRARIASAWKGTPIVSETRIIYHDADCAKDSAVDGSNKSRKPKVASNGKNRYGEERSVKVTGGNEKHRGNERYQPEMEKRQVKDRGLLPPSKSRRRSSKRLSAASSQRPRGWPTELSDHPPTPSKPAFCPPLC